MKHRSCLVQGILFCIFCCSGGPLVGGLSTHETRFVIEEQKGNFLRTVLYDTIYLHSSLLSADSLKVGVIFVPWYFAARSADRCVHTCFYDKKNHKNCCQLPGFYRSAADKGAIGITVGLASLTIFPFLDEDIRTTSRVFAAGIFPLWGLKNGFKQMRHEGCMRPKCEFFCKNKKYYGGCPSGHMAFMAYGATLFSLQFGFKWGLPLGAASVAVFASSVNSNRHFISQLIAGTGLGIMYGVAAHKVVNAYLGNSFECEFVTDCDGSSALQFSRSF